MGAEAPEKWFKKRWIILIILFIAALPIMLAPIIGFYKSDGTIEEAYKMPNIARKVLENFLMIMLPDGSNLFDKLQKIPFDETKRLLFISSQMPNPILREKVFSLR